MAGLSAGLLDRDITIKKAPAIITEGGFPTFDWDHAEEERDVPVQWLPEGSTEAWRAQQRLGSYVTGVFRMYDRDPRPTPDDTRIVFEGRVYDIKPPVESPGFDRGVAIDIAVVARGE